MSIENLKKHVGQLNNTGVRVAVVFRKLPNDETYCLIVETERLPDSYHDYVTQLLNTREAVETNDLYTVLDKRTFPDGVNCLTALHQRGYLRKEPVSNVSMLPLPNKSVPLGLINATIDGTANEYTLTDMSMKTPPKQESPADIEAIAKGLIYQAEMLEREAIAKREEAYNMFPEVKPAPGRPPLPEEVMAEKLIERKARRKERDRENAAISKVAKKEQALEAKVLAKIDRDTARTV